MDNKWVIGGIFGILAGAAAYVAQSTSNIATWAILLNSVGLAIFTFGGKVMDLNAAFPTPPIVVALLGALLMAKPVILDAIADGHVTKQELIGMVVAVVVPLLGNLTHPQRYVPTASWRR